MRVGGGRWAGRQEGGGLHYFDPLLAFSKADEPCVASAWASSELVSGLIGRENKPAGGGTHTHTHTLTTRSKIWGEEGVSRWVYTHWHGSGRYVKVQYSCLNWEPSVLWCPHVRDHSPPSSLLGLHLSEEQRANEINNHQFLGFLFSCSEGWRRRWHETMRQDNRHATSGGQAPGTEAQSVQLFLSAECRLTTGAALHPAWGKILLSFPFQLHWHWRVTFGSVSSEGCADCLSVRNLKCHTYTTTNVFCQIPSK